MIVYTFFHMLGMSSACTNPFLYGFLNDNFLKEFKIFFHACRMISMGREAQESPDNQAVSRSRDQAGCYGGQGGMEMKSISGRYIHTHIMVVIVGWSFS